jgi:hypothetical protein
LVSRVIDQLKNVWELVGTVDSAPAIDRGKDFQGIFAQNDDMGFGDIDALKDTGLKSPIRNYFLYS